MRITEQRKTPKQTGFCMTEREKERKRDFPTVSIVPDDCERKKMPR